MDQIRLSITEDQQLFRQSLVSILGSVEGFSIVHEGGHANDLLDYLAADGVKPDINIIDITLPDISGLELTQQLHKEYPALKNIILTIHEQNTLINKLMNSGASAFLNKNCDIEELIKAIRAVYTFNYYINPQVMRSLQSSSRTGVQPQAVTELPVELTRREKEILQLICKEYSNAEISEKLSLSIRTIEGHRNNLLVKIGCKNTAGLVRFAIKYNLFDII
jgi:DNA-binding NarL/FixJ family response regulator